MNRAFVKLKIAEQTFYYDREQLLYRVDRIKTALKSKSALFAEFENLVTCVKMPTTHASLQYFISDSLLAYVQNYNDVGYFINLIGTKMQSLLTKIPLFSQWFAIRSRLDIVKIRHKEFLENKSWAAVYCRAFMSWLVLRAQLYGGAPPSSFEDCSKPPISMLYAAANIKLHARTLVKFTSSHLNQKYGKENSSSSHIFLTESEAPGKFKLLNN